MSFGLWIAILATLNFWLYALWFRLSSRPVTDSDRYSAMVADAQTRRICLVREAERVWDEVLAEERSVALDEERRRREQEAEVVVEAERGIREIEAYLASREWTA